MKYTVGVTPVVILVGTILFVFFFFIYMQRMVKYIEEINREIKVISQGQLESHIPVKSDDELGELAKSINLMASQLKNSIEEERNAEKTKNELITSVSHDLRTPLTSILGYLGLISNDDYKDEITMRYYVDIAYNKGKDLKKMIDELFEFTKLNYGGLKVDLKKINLGELLEQLAEEFVPIFKDAGMKYRLDIPEKKVFILADGPLLVRVFENLLINAVRYGKEGKYVDINLRRNGNEAIVDIVNYGEIISQRDLPYIFDRFYRVEKSRSQKTGGTGLGLSISKSIVELHHGSIKAFSGEDKTTFEVALKCENS